MQRCKTILSSRAKTGCGPDLFCKLYFYFGCKLHLRDVNSHFCLFGDKKHIKMKFEPQCNKDSDCILKTIIDVPRKKLTLYYICYLRISSDNSLSKVESGSFYLPHIEKSIYLRDSWVPNHKIRNGN